MNESGLFPRTVDGLNRFDLEDVDELNLDNINAQTITVVDLVVTGTLTAPGGPAIEAQFFNTTDGVNQYRTSAANLSFKTTAVNPVYSFNNTNDIFANSRLQAGTMILQGTTAAASPTTGALVVSGGVGVGGELHVGGSINTNVNVNGESTIRSSNVSSGTGALASIRLQNNQPQNAILFLNSSTNTGGDGGPSTCTLRNDGGNLRLMSNAATIILDSNVTIEDPVFMQTSLNVSGTTTLSGNVNVSGTLSVASMTTGNLTLTSPGTSLNVTSTEDSTTISTGSVVLQGGLGVNKNIFAGGVIVSRGTINGENTIAAVNKSNGTNAYAAYRLENDGAANTIFFLNSSTKTTDGGTNTATLRNDAGNLRLQSNSATITLASDVTVTNPLIVTSGGTALTVNGTSIFNNTVSASALNVSGNASVTGTLTAGVLSLGSLTLTNGTGTTLLVNSTDESNTPTTGAGRFLGGLGVLKNINAGGIIASRGNVNATNFLACVNKNSGNAATSSLVLENDGIPVAEFYLNSSTKLTGGGPNAATLKNNAGALNIASSGASFYLSNEIFFQNKTNVLADFSVQNNVQVNGDCNINGTLTAGSIAFGSLTPTTITITNPTGTTLTVNSTEESTDPDTGAVKILGGLGVAKRINARGAITSTGTVPGEQLIKVANKSSVATATTALRIENDTLNNLQLVLNSTTNANYPGVNNALLQNTSGLLYLASNVSSIVLGGTIVMNVPVSAPSLILTGAITCTNLSVTQSNTFATQAVISNPLNGADSHSVLRLQNDGVPAAVLIFNSTQRAAFDNGVNALTLRNDAGGLYLSSNLRTLSITNEINSQAVLRVSDSTPSSSKITGSLIVAGGVGISGSLYVNYTETVDNTNAPTVTAVRNTSAGVLARSVVRLANSGINTCDLFLNGTNNPSDGGTNSATLKNNAGKLFLSSDTKTLEIANDIFSNAAFRVTDTTASVSKVTGALTVAGGVGIQGGLYNSFSETSGTSTGAVSAVVKNDSTGTDAHAVFRLQNSGIPSAILMFNGTGRTGDGGPNTLTLRNDAGNTRVMSSTKTVELGGDLTSNAALRVTDATASTNTTTGCATFAGGVGITQNLNVGGLIKGLIDPTSPGVTSWTPAYTGTGITYTAQTGSIYQIGPLYLVRGYIATTSAINPTAINLEITGLPISNPGPVEVLGTCMWNSFDLPISTDQVTPFVAPGGNTILFLASRDGLEPRALQTPTGAANRQLWFQLLLTVI